MTINFNETQTVGAPIAPTSAGDTYPTHYDDFASGGFRSITTGTSNSTATANEINAIISEPRRKVGMLVFDTTTNTYHRCTSVDPGSYTVEDFGSNAGVVTSVDLSMPTGFTVTGNPIDVNNPSGTLSVNSTLTGIIRGTGSGFAQATAGTHYSAPGHTHDTGDIQVTGAKQTLLGRHQGTAGPVQELTLGSGLALNQSTGVLTASGTGGTVTSIQTSSPITGGTITGTGTIGHANSGVAAGTYGDASTVPVVEVDDKGHVLDVTSTPIAGFLPLSGGTLSGNLSTQDLTVNGDLTVSGTTTTIDTANLTVEDHQIEIGKVANPSDTTADSGGLVLKGATDKSILWLQAFNAWFLSTNLSLSTNNDIRFGTTPALTSTGLGTGIVTSSLTSVGTLTAGKWRADDVELAYGGTGADLSAEADGTIFKKNGTALVPATEGSDYLSDSSVIDGGTY